MSASRTTPSRVVLVDDQPEFLESARVRLSRTWGLEIVAALTSGEQALSLVPTLEPRPDAVLVDVDMPGLDGIETAARLLRCAPLVRVILISAVDTPRYEAVARALGAAFLPKRRLTTAAVLQLIDGDAAIAPACDTRR